jgi:hypothetical protein
MEPHGSLVVSQDLHDQLRPAERLFAAVATPAASRLTDDGWVPVVREPVLCKLAANQEFRAARLEPSTDFSLKPDTFPPELVRRVNGRLIPHAGFFPPRKPPVSVLGQHAAKRITESKSVVE